MITDHYNHTDCMVPAFGTRRRIRALAGIGWDQDELAGRLGFLGGATVYRWTTLDRICAQIAVAVATLYEQLCEIAGPSSRAKQAAYRRGWAPAWAWDPDDLDRLDGRPMPGWDAPDIDEVVVERLVKAIQGIAGYDLSVVQSATPQEREQAGRLLAGTQVNYRTIAVALDLSERTVRAWRAELELAR